MDEVIGVAVQQDEPALRERFSVESRVGDIWVHFYEPLSHILSGLHHRNARLLELSHSILKVPKVPVRLVDWITKSLESWSGFVCSDDVRTEIQKMGERLGS